MNKDRAKQILDTKGVMGSFKMAFRGKFGATESEQIHPDGITEEEDRFIRGVWSQMSGGSSYYDAVVAISQGGVEAINSIETINDSKIVRQHCNKLHLGSKKKITLEDKISLEKSLRASGRIGLAQYVADLGSAEELEDLLVNVIYE